jgi:ankyrin repeat protein
LLHIAAFNDQVDAVQLLVDCKADVQCRSGRYLRTSLQAAVVTDSAAALNVLVAYEKHERLDVIAKTALIRGSARCVRLLLDVKACIGARNEPECEALSRTLDAMVRHGNHETVACLLACRANADAPCRDFASRPPPVCLAARLVNPRVLKMLLEAKADPNARDRTGRCALDFASSKYVKRVLVAAGARTTAVRGPTPAPAHFSSSFLSSSPLSSSPSSSPSSLSLAPGSS